MKLTILLLLIALLILTGCSSPEMFTMSGEETTQDVCENKTNYAKMNIQNAYDSIDNLTSFSECTSKYAEIKESIKNNCEWRVPPFDGNDIRRGTIPNPSCICSTFIRPESFMSQCTSAIAVQQNNISLCNIFEKERDKVDCVKSFIMNSNSTDVFEEDVCDSFTNTGLKNSCISTVAVHNLDWSLCNSLERGQDYCVEEIILKQSSVDFVSNETLLNLLCSRFWKDEGIFFRDQSGCISSLSVFADPNIAIGDDFDSQRLFAIVQKNSTLCPSRDYFWPIQQDSTCLWLSQ